MLNNTPRFKPGDYVLGLYTWDGLVGRVVAAKGLAGAAEAVVGLEIAVRGPGGRHRPRRGAAGACKTRMAVQERLRYYVVEVLIPQHGVAAGRKITINTELLKYLTEEEARNLILEHELSR